MANLAEGFAITGHTDKAEELGKQVLDLRSEVLGENHPDTILSTSNLAMVYRSQAESNKSHSRRAEAADLMVEAVRKGTSRLGHQHPSVLINTYNLALIRLEQGECGVAKDVWASIIGKMEAVLGLSHECTIRCKRYLAIMNDAVPEHHDPA